MREIGERCGGSDYAAVSQARHRMETKLRENMPLAAIAKRIAKHLPMSYVMLRLDPTCSQCQQQAQQIIKAFILAWNLNYSQKNLYPGKTGTVGGRMCWDWLAIFGAAYQTIASQLKCFKQSPGYAISNATFAAVHYWISLFPCSDTSVVSPTKVGVDDGCFDGNFVHTGNPPLPPDYQVKPYNGMPQPVGPYSPNQGQVTYPK